MLVSAGSSAERLENAQSLSSPSARPAPSSNMSVTTRSYKARAEAHPVAVARDLLACMDRKSTNLCVSVDVPTKASLLRIVDAAGPYCCCIKVSLVVASRHPAHTHAPAAPRRTSTSSPTLTTTSSSSSRPWRRSTTFSSGRTASLPTLVRPRHAPRPEQAFDLVRAGASQATRSSCSIRRACTRSPRGRTSPTPTRFRARAS